LELSFFGSLFQGISFPRWEYPFEDFLLFLRRGTKKREYVLVETHLRIISKIKKKLKFFRGN